MTSNLTRPGLIKPSSRRIAFVIEKLALRSGGAERVLVETANALSERGHQVEIISHEYRGKPPFYETSAGVILSNLRSPKRSHLSSKIQSIREKIHRLPDLPGLDRLIWVSRNGGFWRRLQVHLQSTQPDVAIGFMPPAITALSLAKTHHPMRRVASMHNAPEQDFNNSLRWDPSRLDRKRRFELMSGIDRIAVLLPEYRDWYPSDLKSRVTVLPNAVSPVKIAPLQDELRRKIVISVGRLASVKRHKLLIDSWRPISKKFPEWKLLIFGEGPLKSDLEAQIHAAGLISSIHLMGHTNDIAEQYLSSAILAHPAEYEGFPLAVTEALASGLPVVGFEDCSGLNRLVQNNRNGVLVSAEGSRINNFSKALSELIDDETRRKALGAGGPDSIKNYTPEKIIDMWEELLFGR